MVIIVRVLKSAGGQSSGSGRFALVDAGLIGSRGIIFRQTPRRKLLYLSSLLVAATSSPCFLKLRSLEWHDWQAKLPERTVRLRGLTDPRIVAGANYKFDAEARGYNERGI